MSESSSSSGKNKYKKVDISSSCLELADYLRQFPGDIDYSLIKGGQAQLAFFSDPNFTDNFQNLASLKKDLLLLAAEDIAKGVNTLRSSVLGISFCHPSRKCS